MPSIIKKEDFKHKVIVVTINKSVNPLDIESKPVRLYECARKSWIIKPDKANKFDYVIAKYNGILTEIYQPAYWYHHPIEQDKRRYAFDGDIVTDPEIRNLYLNKKMNIKPRSAVIYIEPVD